MEFAHSPVAITMDQILNVAPYVEDRAVLGQHVSKFLSECAFDRIEAWRAMRRNQKLALHISDDLTDDGGFAAAEMVHDRQACRQESHMKIMLEKY
jgi:hypothetical protein